MIEAESNIRVSFLADYPEFVRVLAPEILDHLRHAVDMEDTLEVRKAKLRTQLNKAVLPVALVAHRGCDVLGTAARRASEPEGYEHFVAVSAGKHLAWEHKLVHRAPHVRPAGDLYKKKTCRWPRRQERHTFLASTGLEKTLGR